MKMIVTSIVFFMGLFFNSDPAPLQENVAVIVSNDVNVETINRVDLLEIYTMRRLYWNDGSRIYVADYKGSSEIRSTFYNFIQIRVNAIKKIWLKEQFTGRSLSPRIVDDVDEMLKYVDENPGMIGYVPESMVNENVKILITIPYE